MPTNARKTDGLQRRYRLLRKAAELLPKEKIGQCQRALVPGAVMVIGQYNSKQKRARYRNLQYCQSPSCPVCRYWRARRDRIELAVMLAQGESLGYFPILVTHTLSHKRTDSLVDLRHALMDVYNHSFSGKWWVKFQARYPLVGRVRAIELTYGLNGWHPHAHGIWWLRVHLSEQELLELEIQVKERWLKSLKAKGFSADWQHGARVDMASSAVAAYIAKWGKEPEAPKWGAESELAVGDRKIAHEGLTVLSLLMVAADDPDYRADTKLQFGDNPQQAASDLFVEYFQAFKGHQPITYSNHLWEIMGMADALAGIVQATDFELAAIDFVLIEREDWQAVVAQELRADLLATIKTGDAGAVAKWLLVHEIPGIVPNVAFEYTKSQEQAVLEAV